jgi:hypothetical protein
MEPDVPGWRVKDLLIARARLQDCWEMYCDPASGVHEIMRLWVPRGYQAGDPPWTPPSRMPPGKSGARGIALGRLVTETEIRALALHGLSPSDLVTDEILKDEVVYLLCGDTVIGSYPLPGTAPEIWPAAGGESTLGDIRPAWDALKLALFPPRIEPAPLDTQPEAEPAQGPPDIQIQARPAAKKKPRAVQRIPSNPLVDTGQLDLFG